MVVDKVELWNNGHGVGVFACTEDLKHVQVGDELHGILDGVSLCRVTARAFHCRVQSNRVVAATLRIYVKPLV